MSPNYGGSDRARAYNGADQDPERTEDVPEWIRARENTRNGYEDYVNENPLFRRIEQRRAVMGSPGGRVRYQDQTTTADRDAQRANRANRANRASPTHNYSGTRVSRGGAVCRTNGGHTRSPRSQAIRDARANREWRSLVEEVARSREGQGSTRHRVQGSGHDQGSRPNQAQGSGRDQTQCPEGDREQRSRENESGTGTQ